METEEELGDEEGGQGGQGGLRPELLKSYLAFFVGAVRKRKLLVGLIFGTAVCLATAVAALWPRTYHCETKLTAQLNMILDTDRSFNALRGADEIILRYDNIVAIVKQTDLPHLTMERRPPILKIKDALTGLLHGNLREEDLVAPLVATLQGRLSVSTADGNLTIGVDWSDGQTAAVIVDAAEQNFLEARHIAEVSTIAEYIAILEGHAVKLRDDIDTMAEMMTHGGEERPSRAQHNVADQQPATERDPAAPAPASSAPAAGAAPVAHAPRRILVRTRAEPDEELTRMKVVLEAKQRAVKELEDSRTHRLLDLQSRLLELQTKYTSAHPIVLDVQSNIASLSRESPQVAVLKAEAAELEGQIKQRSALVGETTVEAPRGGAVAETSAPVAGPLPAEIMKLVQGGNDARQTDPAVDVQLGSTIGQYSTLRSQIGSSRIELDRAQAAFKHRYNIVVPVEVPSKPIKPKVPVIVLAGVAAGLVLALATAIIAELRTGKIIERWQVEQLALPVLADLRLPPRSD